MDDHHDHRDRSRSRKTLEVPGATLTYDVRPSDATTEPPLVPHRLADGRRRASRRSPRTSPTARSSPTTRATTASAAPPTTRPRRSRPRSRRTTSTRSSRRSAAGRSTCSPAAAARSSRWRSSRSTRTTSGPLVAHEPPLASLVPDREQALAANKAIHDDVPGAAAAGAGMAQFMQVVMPRRPVHGGGRRGSPRRTRRCSACRPRTTASGPT